MLFITRGQVEVVLDVPDTQDPAALAAAIAAASAHASFSGPGGGAGVLPGGRARASLQALPPCK